MHSYNYSYVATVWPETLVKGNLILLNKSEQSSRL